MRYSPLILAAGLLVVAALLLAQLVDTNRDDLHDARATLTAAAPTATPSPVPFTKADLESALVLDIRIPSPQPAPVLVAPQPAVVFAAAAPSAQVREPYVITLSMLNEAAALAGWDTQGTAWATMRRIIVECECPSLNAAAHNGTDPNGGSFGLAQLNGTYWFERYGEDFASWSDPVVNLRTARRLYEERGRFGGAGGWSCADRMGIY